MQVKLNTSHGDIVIKLYPDEAPKTVENFLSYVNSGHYNGTIFHRVIKGFMIQTGGIDTNMRSKPAGDPLRNEANNGLSNLTGHVSMARTPDPHSATAQFFINTEDNLFLDFRNETPDGWGYCVFGEVSEGMDVVRAIEAAETTRKGGHTDVPVETVEIKSAEVLKD